MSECPPCGERFNDGADTKRNTTLRVHYQVMLADAMPFCQEIYTYILK